MKRFIKVILIIAVVIVILLVGLNLFIKHYLNSAKFRGLLADSVQKAVNRELTLGSITYSVFPPSIIVREVALKEPDSEEDFVSLQEFSLLVDLGKREVTHILLQKPTIRIVEYADGTFNFTDMIPAPEAERKGPGAPGKSTATDKAPQKAKKGPVELKQAALPLSIALIKIEDASFTLVKVPEQGTPTSFTIPALNLAIRDIALDKPIQLDLDMKIGQGSSITATTALGPLRTLPPDIANMNIQLDGTFDLASFKDLQAFMPPDTLESVPVTAMDFTWTGKGTLASEFDFDLTIKTPPVQGRNKLFLDLENRLKLSLPEPALNNILYGMSLPADLQPPTPPADLADDELCLVKDPLLALLLSTLRMNTRITTELLAYEKNEIHNLDIGIDLKAGKLVLSPLSFAAFSGTADGQASLQLTDCPLTYALDTLDIQHIQVADIIQANAEVIKGDFAQGLSGLFSMHADVTGEGLTKDSLEQHLTARGDILLADGQSVSTGGSFLDKLYLKLDNPLLIQVLPKLEPRIQQARINATNETITKLENVVFDFNMKQGDVELTDFQAGTPDYLLKASGDVNPFKETIYLEAQVNLSSNVTMELTDGKDRSDRLPYENDGLVIPVVISGNLYKPVPMPNLTKILQSIAQKETQSKLSETLMKNTDEEDREKIAEGLKALDGLLGGNKSAAPEKANTGAGIAEEGLNLFNRIMSEDDEK